MDRMLNLLGGGRSKNDKGKSKVPDTGTSRVTGTKKDKASEKDRLFTGSGTERLVHASGRHRAVSARERAEDIPEHRRIRVTRAELPLDSIPPLQTSHFSSTRSTVGGKGPMRRPMVEEADTDDDDDEYDNTDVERAATVDVDMDEEIDEEMEMEEEPHIVQEASRRRVRRKSTVTEGSSGTSRTSDRSWILRSRLDGGPTNPELLYGFLGHAAYQIWQGKTAHEIPNLENAPINLSTIRARAQSELENILKNIRGEKCLVIDPKLSGSLSFIVQSSELKKHGAELRHLTAEPIVTDRTKVVYLVRAQLDLMKFICSHIHNDTSKGLHREYYLYFVPRRLVACEKILEEEKVHELLSIGEFPLYMIPLDEDVLSFELDLAQKEFLVDGDATSLWHISKAIHNLEFAHGVIPNIRAKGKASTRVAEIMNRMQAEEPVNATDTSIPEINTLILLDREVDMVTPMCCQLTYEGLLDEILNINDGAVELDASIMGSQQEGKKVKVPLNSSDKLFKEIRDLNFEVVVQVLRQKATSMKQDYTEISTNSQTVSELKDFVKKLNSLPEMTRHINLAQHLSAFTSKPSFPGQLDMEQTLVEAESYDICFDYIEELIHKQEPLVNVLRLLILFSITNSGLQKKNFDYLRRELLHSYGFEHIATLNNLEMAGLFRKQDARSNWMTIKNALQLIVEDTDTTNPNDVSYVFSGYAPLSIRLVQQAIRSGWRPIEDILKLLPGPHSESKRGGFSSVPSYDTLPGSLNSSDKLADGRRSLVLVVFIGGVTFAEISALRFLTSQEGMAYDLIVGTTKIINGRSLIQTFIV